MLLFLWFLTDHWSSRNNENVLLLTPISLVLVVLLPLALKESRRGRSRGDKGGHDRRGARSMALVIKVLPWFHQHNLELIGLILPVHAGLLRGLRSATAPA